MTQTGKWQVHSDDYGNIYFYNSITGESVWELPDEEPEVSGETVDNAHKPIDIEKPREQYSVYSVAVGVADVMVKIIENIEKNAEQVKKTKVKRKFMSPVAEKRFLKNAANDEKKKKHLHDRTVTAYTNILIPKIGTGGSEESKKPREVGSLFTAEESRRWQQERELEREVKRRAVRRVRRQHHAKVESLQKHQHMLIQFRSDLMKYLLGKIKCSTELQKQRILLLTTPQMLAEMKERKREMQMKLEPEIAEKTMAEERLSELKYDKNVRNVFDTIDEAGTGKLHLLQILFGVFSKEKPQKYAAKVRGLAELLGSPELQRFLVDFVSQADKKDAIGPHLITVSEFREFVSILEEVLDHYAGVKAAVEDAENDIAAIIAAASSGGVSLAQARMGALSAKKIEHELAVLKEHEAQLEAARQREKKKSFGAERESFVAPKEEWEKNHHHRLIRLEESSPVYCCLCRRRKWELWRREQEEIESEYRSHWPTMLTLRVKAEELRFVQERDGKNGIPIEIIEPARQDKQEQNSSIVDTKYEISSDNDKPRRRAHKKKATRSPRKHANEPPTSEVPERVKVFENEEQERKSMYIEERHMVIMLERNRRILERPLLRIEDAAHDAFIRLVEHCVNPSGCLLRLEFERCLSFTPPHKMVLAARDNSVKSKRLSKRLVLQTIPCRTEKMAGYIFSQVANMQKTLRSPFVAEVESVDKHMFQLFSELGLLVECRPVVFVVTEYFDCGSWLIHYQRHFINENVKYSAVEQHLRNVFREVASGLAAMHSLGLLHLNVNLGNVYIAGSADNSIHVKIGGLSAWKHDFEAANFQDSNMHDCFNYNYAPPEVVKEAQITAKADSWMLGCALCEALFMWQRQQLILSAPNQPAQSTQSLIFHTKSIGELLQKLPIATSSSLRSLLRMLLQPNPAQRPQMKGINRILSMTKDHAQKLTLKELFQAAQQDDFEAVRDYLQVVLHDESESNAQSSIQSIVEPKTNNSLLHYACDNGNVDACKYLLMCEGFATAFLNEPNAFGHTPLFYAASSGNLSLVKWLVSNGADIDTDYSDRGDIEPRDEDLGIFTPLQIASFRGHEDVANFLVECNAELSGTRRNSKTPLHFASAQNHPAIVKLLIEAGADVHACDGDGRTPVDVAHSAVLPLLLPDEYDVQNEDNDLETGSGDNDDDDEFEGDDKTKGGMESVKSAFGAEIARAFRSKAWKTRVAAINDASMCFQNVFKGKKLVKMFDGACFMMEIALQDAVSQVASSCCTSLLKIAFNAVMSDKDFHTKGFHEERPVLQRIATALLLRGAGSNEKDSSEAVSSLLFLICKSTDITRYLTLQISQMMMSSTTPPLSPSQNSTEPSVSNTNVSRRHQLVAIKVLTAITNQYRLDEKTSGLSFADALKISMVGLENSSVHVRTASIDLLVQCLVIRCEESGMKGTTDGIYEHTKNWCESLFKQQNQQLKPSIQAKINTGLKNALQKSKRLSNRADESSDTDGRNGIDNSNTAAFDIRTAMLSPRTKASQREDDLPYAEPIQGQNKDLAGDMLACFGEKATRCLFSNAWAPRVEALSYLQYLVETRQLSFASQNASRRTLVSAMQTTLMQALQDRVNSVFEAGVSLLMEVSIACEGAVASPTDVNVVHDLIRPLIPRLLVKLGDSKNRLHVATEDALLLLSRQASCIGPVFLLEELIACDRNSSPQTLSATYLTNKMALVSKLMLEFGIIESSDDEGLLPIRNMLQLALQVCEHKDQNVRQMSLQIVADTMQVARSAAMPFLDALARSSRQKLISKLVERGVMESDMLMDEVDDFDIPTETARPGTSGTIRPPTASGSSTKHRPVLTNPSLSATSSSQSSSAAQSQSVQLPYGTALTTEQRKMFSNIIQGFGEELVRCLLDKAWAQREAAIREVERQVLCCASGRVVNDSALPKTLEALGMLAQMLEIGLNDTVARVFQCALRLFQVIAAEFLPLVSSENQYVDEILENVVGLVLQKLGDTKQRLRQDCFTLLHSMASLTHVGHARMCKMLAEKYQQLTSSSSAVASSPLVIGELLRLFTMLVREAPAGENHEQPEVSRILGIVISALENKHVDVRNAAITTYVTIYEATNGGTNDSYGEVDLNSFLAELKPSIRETITRSVVQITKTLPSSMSRENDDSSRSEIESGRKLQRVLGADAHKLQQICTAEITELLTSPTDSRVQRCLGVDKLVDYLVDSSPDMAFKGAWETCCLLVKQLTLDAAPTVCLAAFDLLQLLVDPPTQNASYAIPWGEWGVHLVLGSTIRSVVQQSASENVRVRLKVRDILRLVAGKSAVGKNAVCNAILSAPEQSDMSGSAGESIVARKIAFTKLRWQLTLRLELLYEFLVVIDSSGEGALSSWRKPTGRGAKSSSEPLGLENVVPFLGSCMTHPSPMIKTASIKIVRFLRSTSEEQFSSFIQASCSAALQRRLQALMAQAARNDDEGNNADHFDADRTTCVRGSRASHVRRVAALRPPRSVPVEETQMMVDVFPPPNSAPGISRRIAGADDDDSMNDGSRKSKQQPIWLEKSGSKGLSRKAGSMSFDDGEPEGPVLVGGGVAGLMKARRKTPLRGNNDDVKA
ncbi:AGC/PKC protein kinase [Phytophthora nicotianae INRA-310]|uniref:AGC/PKC protein kinase n=1 Tax=Phytophthora nicotianae (strain INRA-310) TaxID=761204 RepID=W2RJS1_PHYN3|nr:AGC/PKC protein kinase [Phytophthora nicotianae INRA-310]ETN24874.1 AGC/PKC protein kinase [Phytophthora nicotianae INRA-310]